MVGLGKRRRRFGVYHVMGSWGNRLGCRSIGWPKRAWFLGWFFFFGCVVCIVYFRPARYSSVSYYYIPCKSYSWSVPPCFAGYNTGQEEVFIEYWLRRATLYRFFIMQDYLGLRGQNLSYAIGVVTGLIFL
jgi:hypothetical protein